MGELHCPRRTLRVRMVKMSQTLLLLPFLLCLGGVRGEEAEVEVKESRAPRLFYAYTTSSTTTIFTQTICYMSTATAPVACGKRKKRFTDFNKRISLDGAIEPFRTSDLEGEEEEAPELDTSKDVENKRDGKFLVYWLTTTSLSTLTSFTRTVTIGSIGCTPSGYTNTICNGK